MSVGKRVDIHCDRCGDWEFCGSDTTPTRARRIAQKRYGWSRKQVESATTYPAWTYFDLCPRCAEECLKCTEES